jgi:hypothetical protein
VCVCEGLGFSECPKEEMKGFGVRASALLKLCNLRRSKGIKS